jgi:competence protein ComEC
MRVYPKQPNPLWKRAPFIRILLPLIGGTVLAFYFDFFSSLIICVISLLLLLLGGFIFISPARLFGKEWIAGIAIHLVLFLSGCVVMHLHRDIQVESHNPAINNSSFLMARLLGDPRLKSKSYKCSAEVNLLINNQAAYHEQEKIFVYFSTDADFNQLADGTCILFRKSLKPIENFSSSNFDYKNYCRLKHIYAQVFLSKSDFLIIHKERTETVSTWLDFFRRKLLCVIKSHITGKSACSLLEALLLGFTEDLEPALMKSYADTGVVHIIAISGMHLALICQILQALLPGTGPKKSGRWIRWTMLVITLWCYSLFSGGSPSVIRAATMFSLVLFAKTILREHAFYNTLAASAFVLICFDPYWMWDIGFQLSFAAILSLRLFSKPLQNLYHPHNKILAGLWDLTSVSIAAQILTTPLSIYYFHRFPVYFLIANLLAVPISSIVLTGGILLCICSPIYVLAHQLGKLLECLILFLNRSIEIISRLPGAVIEKLEISLTQLFICYLILICLYHFILQKDNRWLLFGLGAIIAFQLSPLM